MWYALSLSSGASGRALRTALRAATALSWKLLTDSWSSSSIAAPRARWLKPSTSLTMPSGRRSCVSRSRGGFWVSTLSSLSVFGVEDLGQVVDAGVVARAAEAPLEVHQAAGVAGDQGVRPTLLKGIYLLVCHRHGDVWHLHGEGSPEPAAELLLPPVCKLESFDVVQQLARLPQETQLPPLVAAGVEDGLTFVAGAEVGYLEHVHQEVRELPDAMP